MDFRFATRAAVPLLATGLVVVAIFGGSWLAGARLMVLAVEATAVIVALRLGWRAPFAVGFAVSAVVYELGGGHGRVAGMLDNIAASVVFEHFFALVFGFVGGLAAYWAVSPKSQANGT